MTMIYYKYINDRQVFSECLTIELNGAWISNPTAEQIAEAGWLPYTPPAPVVEPQTSPRIAEVLTAVKRMLSSSVADLTDEEALEVASLYPTWHSMIGKEVAAGQRLWDDEKLWKVLQPHTVQENWRPADSPSLYVEVTIEEWPAWKQPVGSTDAYNIGDKVAHNDKHWISFVDGNVWEPGVYGWNEA